MATVRLFLVLVLLAFAASPALAHKLLMDARVADDKLRVEAFYDDDTPAQGAKITVENDQGTIIHEGKTDERGVWSCGLPMPGQYTLRAESVGHAAKKTLTISGAPPSEKIVIPDSGRSSSGPIRDNETSLPWLRVVIGLGVIAVLGTALLVARRRTSTPHD